MAETMGSLVGSEFDPMHRDDTIGRELDFLAVDRNGAVAVFSSGGFGAVPRAVLEAGSAPTREDEFLARLPETTSPSPSLWRWAFPSPYWDRTLAKGIYVFEYPHAGKCYVCIGRPRVPIALETLDAELRSFAGLVNLPGISFRTARSIRLEEWVPCE